MFENPGGKISRIAKILFVLECIATLIFGIFLMVDDSDLIIFGLLIIVVGIFIEYLMCLFFCAFGELVENSANTSATNEAILHQLEKQSPAQYSAPVTFAAKPSPAQKAPRPQAPSVSPAQSAAPEQKPTEQKRPPFEEALSYALKFQTDDGMNNHLRKIAENAAFDPQRELVQQILTSVPLSGQRRAVMQLLQQLSAK